MTTGETNNHTVLNLNAIDPSTHYSNSGGSTAGCACALLVMGGILYGVSKNEPITTAIELGERTGVISMATGGAILACVCICGVITGIATKCLAR